MKTEFRKADARREIRSLMAFDRKVFSSADAFDAATWKIYESYWMLVDGVKAGCCAFERNVDFDENADSVNPPLEGSLYIGTTGILPAFQGRGFGTLLKAWEVTFARYHGFRRVVTNTRKRNSSMVRLNRKFGFRVIRTVPRYYTDPSDATVVMELRLRA